MNIDKQCYICGCAIAEALKDTKAAESNLKSMAQVMKQHGPYAFLLYINKLYDKDSAYQKKEVETHCLEIVKPFVVSDVKTFEDYIQNAAENPATLSMVKQALDQAFAYAAYHYKSFGNKEDKNEEAT